MACAQARPTHRPGWSVSVVFFSSVCSSDPVGSLYRRNRSHALPEHRFSAHSPSHPSARICLFSYFDTCSRDCFHCNSASSHQRLSEVIYLLEPEWDGRRWRPREPGRKGTDVNPAQARVSTSLSSPIISPPHPHLPLQ